MNILFICDILHPMGSGAEYANYLLANYLATEGYRVTIVYDGIINKGHTQKETYKEITYVPLKLAFPHMPPTYLAYYIRPEALNKIVEMSKNFDVVIIGHYVINKQLLVKLRIPKILLMHDYFPLCPLSTKYNYLTYKLCTEPKCSLCIFKYGLRKHKIISIPSLMLHKLKRQHLLETLTCFDKIVFVSKGQREVFFKGISKIKEIDIAHEILKRSDVSYNIVVPQVNNFTRTTRATIVIYNGGLMYEKGYNIVLDVANRAKENKLKLSFILTRTCQQHMIKKANIIFLGNIPRSTYTRILWRSMVALYPSLWYEPFGYAVAEIIFAKVPLISSQSIGLLELFCNEGINPTKLFTIVKEKYNPLKYFKGLLEVMRYYQEFKERSIKAYEILQKIVHKGKYTRFKSIIDKVV